MRSLRAIRAWGREAFGDCLVALSGKVAEASKEGGFLGIGGTRVSQAEEQAIADITAAAA